MNAGALARSQHSVSYVNRSSRSSVRAATTQHAEQPEHAKQRERGTGGARAWGHRAARTRRRVAVRALVVGVVGSGRNGRAGRLMGRVRARRGRRWSAQRVLIDAALVADERVIGRHALLGLGWSGAIRSRSRGSAALGACTRSWLGRAASAGIASREGG